MRATRPYDEAELDGPAKKEGPGVDVLRILLLVCHLLALALLLGGFLVRRSVTRDIGGVLTGAAGAMLGTGVLLAAVRAADGLPVNGPKIGVKLVVAAAVLGCVVAGNRWSTRAPVTAAAAPSPRGALVTKGAAADHVSYHAAAVLTVLNIAIAVAWN